MILTQLAELPEKTLLDETAMANALGVCNRTVRAMVARGELPPPIKLGGRACWFAGRVIAHIELKAELVAREAERANERLRNLNPGA